MYNNFQYWWILPRGWFWVLYKNLLVAKVWGKGTENEGEVVITSKTGVCDTCFLISSLEWICILDVGLLIKLLPPLSSMYSWNAIVTVRICFTKLFLTKELISRLKRCSNGTMAEFSSKIIIWLFWRKK